MRRQFWPVLTGGRSIQIVGGPDWWKKSCLVLSRAAAGVVKVGMNTQLILNTSRQSLAGELSFGEVVGALSDAGVEVYRADYVTLQSTYYGAQGEVVIAPLSYEGLPAIAPAFATEGLKAAILDSQHHGQKYREFTRRAMSAGVTDYTVFLGGKRVVYTGRHGEQHIEWFPGAGPAVTAAQS